MSKHSEQNNFLPLFVYFPLIRASCISDRD